MATSLIQVTNVSPSAGLQQMRELFSYFGDIEELRLFPEDELAALSVPTKVCFIKFMEEESALACLHLSNTVLIDRALIIGRSRHSVIPDGSMAMSLAAPAVALANSSTKPIGHTAPLLPTPPSATPTVNPTATPAAAPPTTPLISMMGTVVPQPPPLTGNVDPTKIEEIRRTIYVGNLASNMTAEQVLTFFQPCGEIKYVRMAGDETQPTRFAFVEFATPESVPIALQYNGAMFGERPIKVNHSKNAIVKPQGPTPQEAKRDVDEAMKRVMEAMMDIEATVVPGTAPKKPRSRSRSRDRDRDKRRRSRSRSRDRRRSRDRFRRKSYSRSPVRRRSRSRSPARRRSRSRSPVRRRSRSRSPRRRSRSRSPRYSRGRYYRSRSRSRSPRRHRGRRSRSRSPRRRDRRRGDSMERGRDRSPRKRSASGSPEATPPRKSSKSKKHRRRSYSRTPSPDSANERPSSKKKKHSKKHRRHRKSRTPSPARSPPPKDVGNGRGSRENSGSGGSPPPCLEKGVASVDVVEKEAVEPDTDSSYD